MPLQMQRGTRKLKNRLTPPDGIRSCPSADGFAQKLSLWEASPTPIWRNFTP
jgi:hypothetical protein